MTARTSSATGIGGRHVLLALVGFFGVMFVVNAIFVYFAVATFSGGDTSNPYRKGLDYNETLKAAERQAERGWQTELAYDGERKRLSLSFLDKGALPVTGLTIKGRLSRPATDREDRKVELAETSQGVYAATIDLAPGLWVLSVASRKGGEHPGSVYRLKRRLFVAEAP
ncbi:MAG TPA: FixH family protein [Methyloceanibacter sp.]|jgi:nitrogen fixation protein FixH|nr:FixH family protein [Methyloceanibacter sp.]